MKTVKKIYSNQIITFLKKLLKKLLKNWKEIILLLLLIAFALGLGYRFGYQKPDAWVALPENPSITESETNNEETGAVVFANNKELLEGGVSIFPNQLKKVTGSKKQPKTFGYIVPPYEEYIAQDDPNENKVFYTLYASDSVYKKIKNKEPLLPRDEPFLTIQTYTSDNTGFAYSRANFQFYEKPAKTKYGPAFISRSFPPAAVIHLAKSKRLIVVTALNGKILSEALENLKIS